MYSRHVNSAIGRGRPDLAKVADGIAASLRQFSISARRGAEDNGPPPSRSRTERTANATKEVSDLAPPRTPSRGIDARSLAAKPAPSQGFTIRREYSGNENDSRPSFNRPPSSTFKPRTTYRGGSSVPGGVRGGGSSPGGFRGGGVGGGMRGGAFRGRGRGGPRGGRGGPRGRNARGPKDKKPKFAEEADFEILPYTDEELPDYNTIMGGFPEAYNPITSHASLAGWGPSVISSAQGVKEMVDAKLATAVGRKFPGWNSLEWHKETSAKAGVTVYKDAKERELAREFQQGKGWGSGQYKELSEVQKEKLSKQWVGGHYDGPVAVDRKDVLGQVAKYAKANSTYLAEESKQFEQDVAKLLPAAKTNAVKKTP